MIIILKVSIICGVYNAYSYLRKCLNSMLNQSYKNIEIILVVNASIDGSECIVREFEEKYPQIIRAFYMDKKLGAGGSRQFGLEYAEGDYICFVDCDDVLNPDYIKNMMSIFFTDSTRDTDIVICNFKKIDEKDKQLYIRKYKNKESALVQSIAPWGKIFRKDYLKENEMILRNIPFGEDIMFSSEVYLTNPKVELCDYIGYSWRNNLASTSHTELRGFPPNTIEKSKQYFEYMKRRYTDKIDVLNYFIYKYYIWYLLQSGRRVPINAMKTEYDKIFNYLKISNVLSDKNNLAAINGERLIIKIVLFMIMIMEKLHLSKIFFMIYSQSFLGYFWPNL